MSDFLSGVTIKVNGTPATITSATRQSNHAVVNYALADPVAAGDTVTWEYAAASGHIVAESGGAALADVSAQTVTNNVAGGGPAPLLDLEADTGVISNSDPYAGTGTITQSGTTITGNASIFQSEIMVGDTITAAGISGVVQSITSDTVLELDTSATVAVGVPFTVTPQFAYVTQWTDQSGNGRHFTQSATLERPSLRTVAGGPALYFDQEAYNYMQRQWLLGPTFADNLTSFTVISVYKFNAVSNWGYTLIAKGDLLEGGDPGWRVFVEYENGIAIYKDIDNYRSAKVASTGNTELPTDNFAVYSGEVLSFTDSHSYFNGINTAPREEVITTAGVVDSTANAQPVRIGASGHDVSNYSCLSGWIKALRVYSPALSSTDRAAVEAELATRYGITL